MMPPMIGDRLKDLRTGAGIDQPGMGKIAGTSKQYVWRLEKGLNKDPNPHYIERWAKHFRVRMEWITTGKGPKEALIERPQDDWEDVVGYSQAVGLGTSGPEAAEWAETHKLKFRRDSLTRKRLRPDSLRVMYGKGDSMEPMIESGDAILFDVSDTTPKHRAVYVVLVPGAAAEEYNVKRYISSKGSGHFVADNPDGDHDWQEPRPADSVKVVGRVRWVGGWVR